MKKNLNVIHIKGIKGLIFAAFVVICLTAGFIAFPGLLWMHIWNWGANNLISIPQIGLIQGVLLWAIILTAYFIFRKEKVVVCVKSPKGLSEEELKAVFADIKKQSEEDPRLKAILKAREADLKIKTVNNEENDVNETVGADSNKL